MTALPPPNPDDEFASVYVPSDYTEPAEPVQKIKRVSQMRRPAGAPPDTGFHPLIEWLLYWTGAAIAAVGLLVVALVAALGLVLLTLAAISVFG